MSGEKAWSSTSSGLQSKSPSTLTSQARVRPSPLTLRNSIKAMTCCVRESVKSSEESAFLLLVFFGSSTGQERPLETSVWTKCQQENHRFLLSLSKWEGVELELRSGWRINENIILDKAMQGHKIWKLLKGQLDPEFLTIYPCGQVKLPPPQNNHPTTNIWIGVIIRAIFLGSGILSAPLVYYISQSYQKSSVSSHLPILQMEKLRLREVK